MVGQSTCASGSWQEMIGASMTAADARNIKAVLVTAAASAPVHAHSCSRHKDGSSADIGTDNTCHNTIKKESYMGATLHDKILEYRRL